MSATSSKDMRFPSAIRALDTGKGTHDPDDPANAERLLSFRVHD